MIYVDTSLLLPVYVPEVHSELANSVVKGACSANMAAPQRRRQASVAGARLASLGSR